MTWRYQPVWVGVADAAADERHYSLAEVYLDAAGRLENWTMAKAIAAGGVTPAELTADLAQMLMDANLYKPVAFLALKVGMMFERVAG